MERPIWKSEMERIGPINRSTVNEARKRIESLAIPLRALGLLHEVGEQLAGIAGSLACDVSRCSAVVFCGDHGIAQHEVSAYPQYVTETNMKQMVLGKATICLFSRINGAQLTVVDIGVNGERLRIDEGERWAEFIDRRIEPGTQDFLFKPAMTIEQVEKAIDVGFQVVDNLAGSTDLFVLGEMGIGNTSASSALTAVLLDRDIDTVTGPGTGLTGKALQRKCDILRRSLERNNINELRASGALQILSEYGGYEIAGMVGGFLACAVHRKPVMIDGFICAVAALVASKLSQHAADYQIGSTMSPEPGHREILAYLGKKGLLDMRLRLGEGTGSMLAVPIVRAAARHLNEIGLISEVLTSLSGKKLGRLSDMD